MKKIIYLMGRGSVEEGGGKRWRRKSVEEGKDKRQKE